MAASGQIWMSAAESANAQAEWLEGNDSFLLSCLKENPVNFPSVFTIRPDASEQLFQNENRERIRQHRSANENKRSPIARGDPREPRNERCADALAVLLEERAFTLEVAFEAERDRRALAARFEN